MTGNLEYGLESGYVRKHRVLRARRTVSRRGPKKVLNARVTAMKAKLVMFKSDGQRKDFGIAHDKTLIGRAEDCDFQIPLLSVSRHHCEIIKSDDDLKIRDLSSSNGTYVNNQRVNEKALKAGMTSSAFNSD